MRKLRVIVLTLCAVGALFIGGFPPPAAAAGLPAPVVDCSKHGRLLHHYSAAELRNALKSIPAEVAEYTNCSDVINQALLADLRSLKPGGSVGSGGSFLPVWVIVVLGVLVVAGAGSAALAARNRRRAT